MFDNLTSVTAKTDLLQSCRRQLLSSIARTHGFRIVLLGDSSTLLATRVLSHLSLGRGSQISQDTVSTSGV